MRARLRIGTMVGVAGFLTGVLLFAVLTGCSAGGSGGASASGGGQATSLQQQARAVWLDYARCVRSHGHPNFPDPQVDSQGRASFGNSEQVKSIGQQVQASCGPILSRLPAAVLGGPPVTSAQLHQEVLFAGCMRQHGLPEWPDPRPDGTFPLASTPYANLGKTGPVATALQACRAYETFGGVRGSS
jgi:hypothetical protein